MLTNAWPPGYSFRQRLAWFRTVYLLSDGWAKRSRGHRKRFPVCQCCGLRPSKFAHHTALGYKVLGFEDCHECALLAACEVCHPYLDDLREKTTPKPKRAVPRILRAKR